MQNLSTNKSQPNNEIPKRNKNLETDSMLEEDENAENLE